MFLMPHTHVFNSLNFISFSGVSAEDEHIGLDISMHNESMSGLKLSQLKQQKDLDLSPK